MGKKGGHTDWDCDFCWRLGASFRDLLPPDGWAYWAMEVPSDLEPFKGGYKAICPNCMASVLLLIKSIPRPASRTCEQIIEPR